MLTRQKSLLFLLRLAGGSASRQQVMKWCFLIKAEGRSGGGRTFYDFLPFQRKPYSFCLEREVTKLAEKGILEIDSSGKEWLLLSSVEGLISRIPEKSRDEVWTVFNRFGKFQPEELAAYIELRYPWYAWNEKNSTETIQGSGKGRNIYTLGYQGLSVDEFLGSLIRNDIRQLFDVRHHPVARRYGFHRSTLRNLCGRLEIDYSHFSQLGIHSSRRKNLKTREDYERLFDWYKQETLPAQERTLHELSNRAKSKPTAFVCMEEDPDQCHRKLVAEAISDRTGLPIIHLRGEYDQYSAEDSSTHNCNDLPASLDQISRAGLYGRNYGISQVGAALSD